MLIDTMKRSVCKITKPLNYYLNSNKIIFGYSWKKLEGRDVIKY